MKMCLMNKKKQWLICEDFSGRGQINDTFVGNSNLSHTLKRFTSFPKIFEIFDTCL